jgi:hypothetical protein
MSKQKARPAATPEAPSVNWQDISDIPATFPPSAHTHAISFAEQTLDVDVPLTLNNTWYNGPSITLGAGTWLVLVGGHYRRGTTGAANVAIRAISGGTVCAQAEFSHASVTNTELNPIAFGVLSLLSEETVTLQMLASLGSALALMKAGLAANGTGNTATKITAFKLA